MNIEKVSLAIGGRVVTHLAKSGEVSGPVSPKAIAQAVAIDLLKERTRLVRRMRRAANNNARIKAGQGPCSKAYLEGSEFAFNHAARIIKGEAK